MDLDKLTPNKSKAIFFAKKQLAVFVTDAVNLEGINLTLPEVQTLLDGITIGGHKLSDTNITLNQISAWKYLFTTLENSAFLLNKTFVCDLHNIAGKEEALEWGHFRSGKVTIAGTTYLPPVADKLDELWQEMLLQAENIENIYKKATFLFLQMARNQYFYDVNKRMGRFIMNAILLNSGYPAINVPAIKQLDFNRKMLTFYDSNNMDEMHDFLLGCIDIKILSAMS